MPIYKVVVRNEEVFEMEIDAANDYEAAQHAVMSIMDDEPVHSSMSIDTMVIKGQEGLKSDAD